MVLIIVTIILFFDQFSKILLSKALSLNSPQPVIKGFFYLTLLHNRGAAFGILKNQNIFFVAAALAAVILIAINLKKGANSALMRISLALILAGAIGNLIDRLFFGYVIDFLDFRVWPVFNLADSSITIGAFILGWQLIFPKRLT